MREKIIEDRRERKEEGKKRSEVKTEGKKGEEREE